MLSKQQKKEIVEKITQAIKDSKVTLVCDFKGLTVSEISELRNELRKEEAVMQVAKKTLIQLAFEKAKMKVNIKDTEGQIAVIYGGTDETFSPKTAYNYSKQHGSLKILKGILEEKELSQEEVISLAKLPSKDELLAKVVGSLKSPMSGLVNVLGGNLRSLVYTLKAIQESKN